MELDQGIQIVLNSDKLKRGLVIGKFMPPHLGHIALIKFAAEQCDELIVSMSYTPRDPIDYRIRFSWISEIFRNDPKIWPEFVLDDFDDETLPLTERTKIWADFIRRRFPPVDLIFSSEEYGDPFAQHLGARHIPFNQLRDKIPVSATQIRKSPLLNWDFIPEVVRPYFVKKICFYGAESTGKSTMAKYFADRYNTEFVPEVAREMITSNDFSVEDIIAIGKAQTARVVEKTQTANRFLFCDTDIITTAIYSQHYLHQVPEILQTLERETTYDHYFMFDIDLPWVADELRDLGDKRQEMFTVFKEALQVRGIEFTLVSGATEERIRIIETKLQILLR